MSELEDAAPNVTRETLGRDPPSVSGSHHIDATISPPLFVAPYGDVVSGAVSFAKVIKDVCVFADSDQNVAESNSEFCPLGASLAALSSSFKRVYVSFSVTKRAKKPSTASKSAHVLKQPTLGRLNIMLIIFLVSSISDKVPCSPRIGSLWLINLESHAVDVASRLYAVQVGDIDAYSVLAVLFDRINSACNDRT